MYVHIAWLFVLLGNAVAVTALATVIVRARQREADRRELQRAHSEAHAFLDAAQVILVGLDPSGHILLLNEYGRSLLGVRNEEVIGLDWFEECVSPDVRSQARDSFAAYVASVAEGLTHHAESEYSVIGADGQPRLISWKRSVVRDEDGRVLSMLSSGEDITERRHVERQLQFESYLLDSVTDSIIIHNADQILYANSAAAEMRGISREELLGRRFPTLVAPEYLGTTHAYRETLERTGRATFETGHLRADGTVMLLEVHAAFVEYEGRRAIASIGRDITERRQAEERIRQLAFHDSLTGLANRMLFNDRLDQAIARGRRLGQPVALLFMDLDNFKDINDTYGHLSGDRLLELVSERLRSRVRATDTIARFGGDEFAIVMSDVRTVEDAEKLAQELLRAFDEGFEVRGEVLRSSATVGVAFAESHLAQPELLTRLADMAMYEAKRAGRARSATRVAQPTAACS